MNELIQIAFSPVNLIYTFLLILVIFYWLSVIIGALDFGSFDLDFDFDVDADVDIDMDVDTDIEAGGAGSVAGVLHFFNFGMLPFMIIMSFAILFSWAISVLANYYFGNGTIIFPLILFIPNLFLSLTLTKIITTPLIPIFKNLDSAADPVDYIGMTCKLILPASTYKMGQAEVIIDDSPLLVNVKVAEDNPDNIEKGAEALILRKEKGKPFYIITRIKEEKELFSEPPNNISM